MEALWFAGGFVLGGLIVYTVIRIQRGEAERSFASLSLNALRQNSEDFLKLAGQAFSTQLAQAQGDLEQRKQAVEALVKPIRETLDGMEKERQSAYGGLKQMTEALSRETRNLASALRAPQVRGRWGEATLKRVAELTGMVERCDFFEQVRVEGGTKRPDMVICLPNNRHVVVDAKTPLDAYLESIEAESEDGRNNALKRHAKQLRDRYKELAAKAYWASLDVTPEFVVLFLPGEPFLSTALKEDPNLLDNALNERVVLATPATLYCLLSAIRYGWQEEKLTENARHISQLGREMHDRIVDWACHIQDMGGALRKAVCAYNDSIGSLESRVMVSARKLKEMGISSEKELTRLQDVEMSVREHQKIGPENIKAGQSGQT